MASNTEDRYGYFHLDSGDRIKVNEKQTDFAEKIPAADNSKCKSCNTSTEEMASLIDRKISEEAKPCEQMESNILATKTLSAIDKDSENLKPAQGENDVTKHGDFLEAEISKKLTWRKIDKVRNFHLDSRDRSKVNEKQADFAEKIPAADNSKYKSCNTSSEEMASRIDHKISEEEKPCEQMESNILATKTLSAIDKDSGNVNSAQGENDINITKHGDFLEASERAEIPKKSTRRKTDKERKRVHFKSEVETYIFESSLGIRENYNYTEEEFSLENVVSDVFNGRRYMTSGVNHILWEDENYVDSPCPIMAEWLKCDRHFHHLNKRHIPLPVYTPLKDEDSCNVSKNELKGGLGLKRTMSCFFRKNKTPREDESQNLSRRLSMSMHNIRLETKSWFDKIVTKVTKKKTETLPTRKSCIDVGDLADFPNKGLNEEPELKRIGGLTRWKKQEIGSQNATSGNLGLNSWITVQNPKLKRTYSTYSLPNLSKTNKEDIIDDHQKEVKGWTRFARRGGLFRKEKSKDKSEGNLRAWKSTKSLHLESKSFKDKFMMKVMKK